MIEATIHVDDVEIIPHLIPRVAALQTNLVKFNGLFTPRIIACFKHFFAFSPIFPVMFLYIIYDFSRMLVPVTSVETRMLGFFSPAMMRLGEGDNGDDCAYFGILSTNPIRLIRLPAPIISIFNLSLSG